MILGLREEVLPPGVLELGLEMSGGQEAALGVASVGVERRGDSQHHWAAISFLLAAAVRDSLQLPGGPKEPLEDSELWGELAQAGHKLCGEAQRAPPLKHHRHGSPGQPQLTITCRESPEKQLWPGRQAARRMVLWPLYLLRHEVTTTGNRSGSLDSLSGGHLFLSFTEVKLKNNGRHS